jgi:hypothetical protein
MYIIANLSRSKIANYLCFSPRSKPTVNYSSNFSRDADTSCINYNLYQCCLDRKGAAGSPELLWLEDKKIFAKKLLVRQLYLCQPFYAWSILDLFVWLLSPREYFNRCLLYGVTFTNHCACIAAMFPIFPLTNYWFPGNKSTCAIRWGYLMPAW